MSGRSPREAAETFLGVFKQTLSCIVVRPFVRPSGFEPEPTLHGVGLVPIGGRVGDLAPLGPEFGRRGLWLSIVHDYRIVRVVDDPDARDRWRVRTARHNYEILDSNGREVLAYHWHPEDPRRPGGRSRVEAPHLHLSSDVRPIELGEAYPELTLADLHIWTGPMLLEDVVEFLIDECAVAPLREEWRAIIAGNRAHLAEHRG